LPWSGVIAAVPAAGRRARWLRPASLAGLALAGVIVYVATDVLLRFLRPGYSLLFNAESDYGRGAWYWVMDLNFLLRCALSLAIAAALRRAVSADGRLRGGLALIAAWAVCSGLLAFFADDPRGQPLTGSGVIHLLLAFIAFPCVTVGTILVSSSLMAEPAWQQAGRALLAVSAAGAAALLLLASASGHPHAPGGLYERIFLGLELLWIAVAAGYVRRAGSLRHDVGEAVGPPPLGDRSLQP
jgi:hypothetical membrane protein